MAWESNERPFNMAMLYYHELNQIWGNTDRSIMDGELYNWYFSLKALKMKISFKFTKEEKDKIDLMFFEVEQNIPRTSIKTEETKVKFMLSQSAKDLEEIYFKLISVMDKNNMIFPNIKFTHGLDKINKRYKLNE